MSPPLARCAFERLVRKAESANEACERECQSMLHSLWCRAAQPQPVVMLAAEITLQTGLHLKVWRLFCLVRTIVGEKSVEICSLMLLVWKIYFHCCTSHCVNCFMLATLSQAIHGSAVQYSAVIRLFLFISNFVELHLGLPVSVGTCCQRSPVHHACISL